MTLDASAVALGPSHLLLRTPAASSTLGSAWETKSTLTALADRVIVTLTPLFLASTGKLSRKLHSAHLFPRTGPEVNLTSHSPSLLKASLAKLNDSPFDIAHLCVTCIGTEIVQKVAGLTENSRFIEIAEDDRGNV